MTGQSDWEPAPTQAPARASEPLVTVRERCAEDAGLEAPVTLALIALLVSLFIAQFLLAEYAAGHAVTSRLPDNLAGVGALNPDLVQWAGDWWRLFTAPLLHANVAHIAMNGLVLWISGRYVERKLGAAVLLFTLATGAVAGSAMSCQFLGDDGFSVGASGAIMALVTVAACSAYLMFPDEEEQTHRGREMAQVLVLSLLPHRAGVDYAAHFGGALAGGVTGLAACCCSVEFLQGRIVRSAGWLAAAAYAGCAIFGFSRLLHFPPGFDPALLPTISAQLAKLPPAPGTLPAEQQGPDLGDPRLFDFLARAQVAAGDPAAAVRSAQDGMRALRAGREDIFLLGVGGHLRADIVMARVALGQLRPDDPAASTIACMDATADEDLKAMLRSARICLD